MSGSITGTDGGVPIYDPTARWCWWGYHEIYLGQAGTNRYVPKVNDFVVDHDTKATYKVTDVDPTTLVPTLQSFVFATVDTTLTEFDILTGVGPGTPSDTYRAYLDKTVVPYALSVDARLFIRGTMCSYIRIFKGADVSSGGQVVSFLFNPSGQVLTQNIPLELVEMHNGTVNYATKSVPTCYTNVELADGELVTLVAYSADGNVVSRRQLLIEHSGFIRPVSSDLKYITGIAMESPFLSASNDHLLEYPLNVPVEALNLFGIVQYSDGSTLRLPADGTKFTVLGLEQFLSSVIGAQSNLVLSYKLDSSERAIGTVSSDGKYITEAYTLKTIEANGAYTVKLFVYPQWIDAVNGYTLRWFMYNLDRNAYFEVTSLVSFASNSPAFNPVGYGVQQNLIARVNLQQVSQMYAPYIHAQSVTVVLRAQGTENITNWTVNATPGDGIEYGANLHARTRQASSTAWELKLGSELASQAVWLQNVYTQAKPLLDERRELAAPTPNMFVVQVGSQEYEYNINQWNATLTLPVPIALRSTVIVRFIKRDSSGDLQLAVAGMAAYPWV